MSMMFYANGSRRARIIHNAFVQGLAKHGRKMDVMHADNYSGVQSDVAVFYGLNGNLKRLCKEYRQAGKTTIFFDLGYWGQHETNRYHGYHRIAVNAIHASVKKTYPGDRLKKFNLQIQSNKGSGEYIILAGQSAKAAWVYDMQPEEWERAAIEEIRKVTDREIYYHPKLSWAGARPIEGTTYWPKPIDALLPNSFALVTHHSNSSLKALAAGVPIFTVDGVSKSLSGGELFCVNNPRKISSEEVYEFLSGVSYWQWNIEEISQGKLVDFLNGEGVNLCQ